jgi:hypothetical protein
MNARATAAIALSLFALSLAPAAAALPSFAGTLNGTWTCTSAAGSNIVLVFAPSPSGDALDLRNSFVTSGGYTANFTEHYTQQGDTVTLSAEFAPGADFLGTSPGFVGRQLVFTGTLKLPNDTKFQRITYALTDADHFSRVFEAGPSAGGPFFVISSESCTHAANATPPNPAPTPHA